MFTYVIPIIENKSTANGNVFTLRLHDLTFNFHSISVMITIFGEQSRKQAPSTFRVT